jgi:hypothetical protein
MAYEWYQTERKSLTLVYRQITAAFAIGQLITDIGGGEDVETVDIINSVVTRISWDLQAGTTTVQTQYAELDVVQF